MKMKFLKIFFFINIVFITQLAAQKTYSYNDYYESMFSGEYSKTRKILKYLNKYKPNDVKTKLAFSNYYLVMYDISGKSDKYYTLCKRNADFVNVKLSNKKNLTSNEVFYLISAKSILLKIQVEKKQFIRAIKDLSGIMKQFEYAQKHEGNINMKLISGMYNFFIETAKEDYPIAYPIIILFPSGNKKRGLKLLLECTTSNDKKTRIRSKLHLANIYRKDKKNFELSNLRFKQLLKEYPENVFWQSEYIKMLREFKKNIEANKQKKVLLNIIDKSKQLTLEQKEFLKKI